MSDHHHHHDHGHRDVGHARGFSGHVHAPVSFGRAFLIGIALNVAYVMAEAFYDVAAHSLALLADPGHNLGDVLGLAAATIRLETPELARLCALRPAHVV